MILIQEMSNKIYLPLKELITEKVGRDGILFTFLFLLVLAQDWENVFLFLFPLITFGFSLFFNLIYNNKWRADFDNPAILYYPLGSERKHANRLNFCALFLLIVLFWFGAESLYHPQLVDDYAPFFQTVLVFVYTFGYVWIFVDLWKYSRVEIIFEDLDFRTLQTDDLKDMDNLISFLKIKTFKNISLVNFLVFIVLNLLNLATILPFIGDFIPGFAYSLPGTGIEDSQALWLNYSLFFILAIPPILAIIFLKIVWTQVHSFNADRFNALMKKLPQNYRFKVRENLKALNTAFRKEMRVE